MGITSAFFTATSGINATSRALSEIGNNIANAQTIGYKSRTVSFGDLFGATIGTYFLNGIALKSLDSSVVAIFIALQPLVGVAAAVVMLGEIPTLRTVFSGVVILVGTYVATRVKKPRTL